MIENYISLEKNHHCTR